jgi:hypothetical protein
MTIAAKLGAAVKPHRGGQAVIGELHMLGITYAIDSCKRHHTAQVGPMCQVISSVRKLHSLDKLHYNASAAAGVGGDLQSSSYYLSRMVA